MRKLQLLALLLLLALCLTACAAPEPAAEASEMPETQTAEPAQPQDPGCTITIRCDVLLEHLDELDPDKVELVPEDGCLLAETFVPLSEGDTVFSVLERVAREHKLPLEFNATPMYDSKYIEGLCNFYEMDCGGLSGWTYSVNDAFPGYGLNLCTVADGDVVRILYTCDLGADVGNVYIGE